MISIFLHISRLTPHKHQEKEKREKRKEKREERRKEKREEKREKRKEKRKERKEKREKRREKRKEHPAPTHLYLQQIRHLCKKVVRVRDNLSVECVRRHLCIMCGGGCAGVEGWRVQSVWIDVASERARRGRGRYLLKLI
jgi:hypothetical protein